MRVINLTNSPHDLVNTKGEKVRLPARGSIDGFEPHPQHASLYRTLGYFRIEGDIGEPAPAAPRRADDAAEGVEFEAAEHQGGQVFAETSLRDQYRELSGKTADKRWSDKRLAEEVAKLEASQ